MRELDLVIICDSTANMGCYLTVLKQDIKVIIKKIKKTIKCDIHFALVEYRDHQPKDETFVHRVTDFTKSTKTIIKSIEKMFPYGGDDGPESVACAFHCATTLNYREKATKLMFWITDAPPHGFCFNTKDNYPDGCPCHFDFMEMVHTFSQKGIIVYPIGAEPLQFDYLRTLMRAVAEITGGKYADLASAKDMSNFIINSSVEEIMVNDIIINVQTIIKKNLKFLSMKNEDKIVLINNILNEEVNKKDIESAELDSIFRNRLDPIPDIFKTSRNLKDLSLQVINQKDIEVQFVTNFNGGSVEGDEYHLFDENGKIEYHVIRRKVKNPKPENPLINHVCPEIGDIKDPMTQNTNIIKRKVNEKQIERMQNYLKTYFQL
ncbi:VWFA domain-containing protein [Entamoeba marina]